MSTVDWNPRYHALIGLTAVTCFLFVCFVAAIANRLLCKKKRGPTQKSPDQEVNAYVDLEDLDAGHANQALDEDPESDSEQDGREKETPGANHDTNCSEAL